MKRMLLPLILLLAMPAGAENIRLTVFHTNDIHGWVMARPDRKQKAKLVGGAAVLAEAVDKLKEKGQPSLLLDAGDWFQGAPEGTLSRGRIMADVFNALGYDATVVGNHDYDIGARELETLVPRFDAPVLGANVYSAATGERVGYLKPYVLKKLAGVKVGIFGITTSQMASIQFLSKIEGLEFKNEIEVSREMVKKLRAEGADVIIALTHIGYKRSKEGKVVSDQSLADAVDGIDLVVGGHSHTPVFEPKTSRKGTLVVQAGSKMAYLGRVVLEIDPKTRKVVAKEGRLYKLWEDRYGRDERIQGIVDRYRKDTSRQLDVVIGTAQEDLVRRGDRDSAMGNWMTDCTRKWTKTQIAFQNGGGIRSDLLEGPVTLRNMFEVMPFDNYVVTMYMTGDQILKVLETGTGGRHGLIQVSGLRFTVDPDGKPGHHVSDVHVGKEELSEDGVYSVSAPDFLVLGGDDYGAFRESADKAFTQMLLRDLLGWCAKNYSPIRAVSGERITRR